MRSRDDRGSADRERAGGIYAGLMAFIIVWVIGTISDVPFTTTVWRGILGGILITCLATFLLRIVLRLQEPVGPGEPQDQAPPGEVEEGS